MNETPVFSAKQYISFPLCALNFSSDIQESAQHILSLVVWERMLKIWGGVDDDFTLQDTAKEITGGEIENLSELREQAATLGGFAFEYKRRNGTDARVKLHSSVIQETIDGTFKPKHFRTLCSIFSCLDWKKDYQRLTTAVFIPRASGFKSRTILDNEGSVLKIMSRRQVESSRDFLASQGFFAFFSNPKSKRHVYFSRSLPAYQIAANVLTSFYKDNPIALEKFAPFLPSNFDPKNPIIYDSKMIRTQGYYMPKQKYTDGIRNETLAHHAGLILSKGITGDSGLELLQKVNRTCCIPPKPEYVVATVWNSINRTNDRKSVHFT